MKKRIASALVLVMIVTLSAGSVFAAGGKEESGKDKGSTLTKVAIIVPTNNEWNQIYYEQAKETAKSLNQVMTVFDPQNDVQQQISFINSAVSQEFGAIVIQPIDNAAVAPSLKKAALAGVHVISHYDMDPALGINDLITQVLFGQKASGVLEAEMFVKATGETGKVGIIAGLAGADNSRQRSEGIREVLAKYPGIKIVQEINCQWDRQLAMAATEDMITSYPDLTGILSMDDNMSFGIYEAIKAAGKEKQIKIGTQGMYKDSVEAIKSGKFLFSIAYPPQSFSITALKLIAEKQAGKKIESKYVSSMEAVTLANVDTVKY